MIVARVDRRRALAAVPAPLVEIARIILSPLVVQRGYREQGKQGDRARQAAHPKLALPQRVLPRAAMGLEPARLTVPPYPAVCYDAIAAP